jgi:hypothetical protein
VLGRPCPPRACYRKGRAPLRTRRCAPHRLWLYPWDPDLPAPMHWSPACLGLRRSRLQRPPRALAPEQP